jgi:hypothetical protein
VQFTAGVAAGEAGDAAGEADGAAVPINVWCFAFSLI